MTKDEHKMEMIKFFEQQMPIKKAKKIIKEKIKKDEYDNSISTSNVRVLYTSNSKYAFGGVGFYITNGKYTYSV